MDSEVLDLINEIVDNNQVPNPLANLESRQKAMRLVNSLYYIGLEGDIDELKAIKRIDSLPLNYLSAPTGGVKVINNTTSADRDFQSTYHASIGIVENLLLRENIIKRINTKKS